MVETLAGLLIGIFLIATVIYFYSFINTSFYEVHQSYEARKKIYEFSRYYVREVQASENVEITEGGKGLYLFSKKLNASLNYGLANEYDSSFLSLDGRKLFQVSDIWFSQSERMVQTTLWLPNTNEINLYAYSRINEQ